MKYISYLKKEDNSFSHSIFCAAQRIMMISAGLPSEIKKMDEITREDLDYLFKAGIYANPCSKYLTLKPLPTFDNNPNPIYFPVSALTYFLVKKGILAEADVPIIIKDYYSQENRIDTVLSMPNKEGEENDDVVFYGKFEHKIIGI